MLCSQSFEVEPNASKTILSAQANFIEHPVTGIWALSACGLLFMSKGTGDVSLLSMDVMSYSRCVVLVFSPVVWASQTESRGSKRAASGQKGFRYVSPFLTSKRVCTLLLLVDYCHAFLDGGIVEKEKKKCMSSSSPSHTNAYTSFSYVQRSNIKLLQLCCKICFCIVCACLK